MALWLTGLGVWLNIPGCKKEEAAPPGIPTTEAAAREKAAVENALAEKDTSDRMAAEKMAAQKAAADKLAADKAAADKAAADKMTAAEKAEAASLPADLVMMKSEIAQAMSQIDLTMAKLDVLAASTGNLKQPSQDVVTSIETLDTSTQGIKKRADDMRERGAAYFDAWDKQLAAMSTPDVAAVAAKRKDELSAKYTEVLTSMQESRAAFDPFWADMKSLHDTIKDGLSPESLKGLLPQIQSAKDKAATLKTRVAATSDKLNQVSVIYKRP
jgi:hypothetical protein